MLSCRAGVTFTGGTTIAQLYIASSTSGAQKLGASASSAEEHVLKQGTTYIVKVDESATGTVEIGYDLFWYEESGA